jgi:hypothetical protein
MGPRYSFEVDLPANGRFRKATINVRNQNREIITTDKADMVSMEERRKLARRLAERLHIKADLVNGKVESAWEAALAKHRQNQDDLNAARNGEADQMAVEILDTMPLAIRRPLCLIEGQAYAAAWVHVQTTVTKQVNRQTGEVTIYDPPQVKSEPVLAIVQGDGQVYCDAEAFPGALPLAQLGLTVTLPSAPAPNRCWSGAGVKRLRTGKRPHPAEVFKRVRAVADHFLDFAWSLTKKPQEVMPEMLACYVLGTYLLDAFHVTGYLWPNGDPGAGKTTLLQVIAEMSYLGEVILAGGSYAALRDLAEYGATLCFDDAEGVMDVKRSDPDKRSLLLAGNRRGAHVTVKEPVGDGWQTRHIHTFCPRAFSAIRLPDNVLASRSIVVPLVRSADPKRAKANPLDHATWPHDRRQLLDDLWALGLAFLPELPAYDAKAAEQAKLMGRDLEPWRVIFGVALWLEEKHHVKGLFQRMTDLADAYQEERPDLQVGDVTLIAVRALQKLLGNAQEVKVVPKELAARMNEIAIEEDLADSGENAKPFTTPRRVGWLLKRLRFARGTKETKARPWIVTRAQLDALALSYGLKTDSKTQPNTEAF